MTENRAEHRKSPARPPQGGLRALINDNPKLALVLGTAIIVLVTLLAYKNAYTASFIWDDDYYVYNNTQLRTWDGLQQIWFGIFPSPALYKLPQYYPMTFTSFWLEYRLWGRTAMGYHVDNLLLHVANALLIWLLLRKLSVPGSWLAALIFALHPINVESVAWIAERKNVLSMMFFLSSLYVYLRYCGIILGSERTLTAAALGGETEAPAPQVSLFSLPNDPQRLYILALVLFLCALFSKTITNSLPAVVLVIIWWKRGRIRASDVFPLLPLFVLGIGFGALTAHIERWRVGVALRPEAWDYANTLLGEIGARCIIAGHAIWFYVTKLLWPHPLVFNYVQSKSWNIDPSEPAGYIYPISVLLIVIALISLRKQIGRAPIAAVLIFLGTLFPAMGFVDVWPMQYSFVADHFVYLSSIALIALVAGLLARYLTLELLAGFTTLLVLVFFTMSWMHAQIFTNTETLWRDTLVRTNNRSWLAANQYGLLLLNSGEVASAEPFFNLVTRLKPNHPESRFNLARIAEIRGWFVEQEMHSTTAPSTQMASTTGPATRPARSANDFYEQALDFYRQAISLQKGYNDARYNMARRLMAMGRRDEALEQLNRIIQDEPRYQRARLDLANDALEHGDTDTALAHFVKLIEYNPDSVEGYAGMGKVLFMRGKVSDGLYAWDTAMKAAPDDWRLRNDFGLQMASSGQYAQASDYFRRALAIKPDAVEVLTNLGICAARLGYVPQARELFEHAISIDPKFEKAKESLEALNSGRLQPATTRSTTTPS
jgi:tetratricopeptide (TPR) repeat protein